MLEVTSSAAQAIKTVVAEAGEDIVGLRIVASTSGCAGIRYEMNLEATVEDTDAVFDCGGAKLLVDLDSHRLLDGTVIDFRNDLAEAGFVFDNPNARGLCSCAGGSCADSEGLQ